MSSFEKIVNRFHQEDEIAKLFNIQAEIIDKGHSRAKVTIDERMVNGQKITHGAAIFALIDIAFAVASNSHNKVALGLNTSINFLRPTFLGDTLTATATEDKLNKATGSYRVVVKDQKGNVVAVAQCLAYRMQDQTFVEE